MFSSRSNSVLPAAVLALGPVYTASDSMMLGLASGLIICVILLLNLFILFPVRNMFPASMRLLTLLVFNSSLIIVLQILFQAHAFTLQQQLGVFFPLLCINGLVLSYSETLFSNTTWSIPVHELFVLSSYSLLLLTIFGASRELLQDHALLTDLSQLVRLEFSGFRLANSGDGIPLFESAAGCLLLLGLIMALLRVATPGTD